MLKAIVLVLAVTLACSAPLHAQDERKVILKVKAVYPEKAKRMKVTGTVLLNTTVEPSGRVKSAEPVMGESALLESAKSAVLQWRFTPGHFETSEQVEVVFP